ncbi:tRNA (cytosine(38)-C(5))-methyltransferase isoform X9 [Gallus gallus]|uniref:tRNA (cytosine(38)-C(5))-methyltransferase isoform X9 n=1 Tax=Gallus gallus TaxID=9031 RepID=UPI001F014BDB|nr:tRNA (cytosine(38)-C(5))-methyltransferase isoform X9 [Gallus gallus]
MAALRVLELYSGIGGMHQALKGTRQPGRAAPRPAPRRLPPLWTPSSRCAPDPRGAVRSAIFSRGLRWPLASAPSPPCVSPPPSCTDARKEAMGWEAASLPSSRSLEARPPHLGLEWGGGTRVEGEEAVPMEETRESCICAEVVAAVDVNTLANEVYKHNFPSTPLWAKTIEGITLKEFDRLSFDMILMSPPCQPFTRLQKCPKYLLLENVKGFESSSARNELLRTLETCGFKYQEFLLSPTCLGIPNSRLRYFLIAKLHQEPFFFHVPGQILTRLPDQNLEELSKDKVVDKTGSSFPSGEKSLDSNTSPDCSSKKGPLPKGAFLFKLETAEQMVRKHRQDNDPSIQMLEDFLEEENEEMSQYFLAPKSLVRYAFLLDIVKPTCRRSTCFTKGYGHYVEGTGSVLQTAVDVELESVFKHIENLTEEEKLMKLSTLKLRYFTPREIANLHGFPPEFGMCSQSTHFYFILQLCQCSFLLGVMCAFYFAIFF